MSNTIYATTANTIGIDSSNVDISGSLNVTGDLLCNGLTASSLTASSLTASSLTTSNNITCNGLTASSLTASSLSASSNITSPHIFFNNNFNILTFGSSASYRNASNNGWSLTPALQIRYSSVECFTLTSDGILSIRDGLLTGMTTTYSDDRLKHNEVNIINGLEIINQLQPKKYQKTSVALDENYNGDLSGHQWKWEAGIIAQDVEQIDDLSFTVLQGGTYEGRYYPYALNYNNIFVYNIRATQQLHELVQQQAQTIANLASENILIKSKLNEILVEMGKATV